MFSRKYFIGAFILFPFFCSAQFKELDLIEEYQKPQKSQVIYLTAVWCKPCMEKLQPIIDRFGNKEQYDLIVLLDQYGLSDKIRSKVLELYDTALIRLLPSRYYPQENSGVKIRVNPSKKVMKELVVDLNNAFTLKISDKDFWFGNAIVTTSKGIYITKEFDKNKLISEIENLLSRY